MEDAHHVDPGQPSARGGKVEKSAVIRLLATGLRTEAVAKRISGQVGAHEQFSIRDLHEVLAEVVAILKERRLLPPAETAFSERYGVVLALAALRQETPRLLPAEAATLRDNPHVHLTAADLDDLRISARRVVEAYLDHGNPSLEFPQPRRSKPHDIALQYAEALLRQEEILEALKDVDPEDLPLQAALTGADRERVEDFLLYRNLMGRFETLDSLVDQWERSVVWLERDAESCDHEDFSDRLLSRDSLEEALMLISPESGQAGVGHIRALDERFVAASDPVSASIRPNSPWRPQRWWWFRVPHHMGDSFRIRLEHVAPAAAQEAFASRKDPPGGPDRETAD
jgi:hypothetical protein